MNVLDFDLDTGKVRFRVDTILCGNHLVPATFWSDGASIPMSVWSVLGYHPKSKEVVRAALLHDYLISKGYDGVERDRLFYEQLLQDGAVPWKAYVMWKSVAGYRKVYMQ